MNEPVGSHQEPASRRLRSSLILKLLAVFAVLSLALWANLRAAELDSLRDSVAALGYPGLLGASALSGFNLVVPIPVVAFYPFLIEAGFEPVPTLATIALGMTTGDLVGYLIGDASRTLAKDRMVGLRERVDQLHARHPVLPLAVMFLYAAFAPIPNELLVIPLAFMGYSIVWVMAAVFFGNIVFNSLAAFGVTLLLPGLG
ncbi:MAG: hypothetical protein HKO53_07575 [Gemmatimonadetes bacterium]|nr:hypothetical protein [Gemmatimonadota bacterium]